MCVCVSVIVLVSVCVWGGVGGGWGGMLSIVRVVQHFLNTNSTLAPSLQIQKFP